MIIFTRFRNLPDEQMKHIVEYVESGKPIIGMRTATHAFSSPAARPTAKYTGTTRNGRAASAGRCSAKPGSAITAITASRARAASWRRTEEKHPILRGIKDGDIWGPTDVYAVRLPLPGDSKPLVLGQVLEGMKPTDKPVEGKKNDPMMPVAWTKTYTSRRGKTGRVFTTTMGASQDLASEGLRRLLVNATYWASGMEDKIPEKSKVDIVGEYKPSPFRNNGFTKGVKPADLAIK